MFPTESASGRRQRDDFARGLAEVDGLVACIGADIESILVRTGSPGGKPVLDNGAPSADAVPTVAVVAQWRT